jgi:hypothetical protein
MANMTPAVMMMTIIHLRNFIFLYLLEMTPCCFVAGFNPLSQRLRGECPVKYF